MAPDSNRSIPGCIERSGGVKEALTERQVGRLDREDVVLQFGVTGELSGKCLRSAIGELPLELGKKNGGARVSRHGWRTQVMQRDID